MRVCACNLLQEDRRHTVSEIHHEIEIHFSYEASHTRVHRILIGMLPNKFTSTDIIFDVKYGFDKLFT